MSRLLFITLIAYYIVFTCEASKLDVLKAKTKASLSVATTTSNINTYYLSYIDALFQKNKCECKGGGFERLFSQNCMTTAKQVMRMLGISRPDSYSRYDDCIRVPSRNAIIHFRAEEVGDLKHEWIVSCWSGECVTLSAWDTERYPRIFDIKRDIPGKSKKRIEMGFSDSGRLCVNTYYGGVKYSINDLEDSSNSYKIRINEWVIDQEDRMGHFCKKAYCDVK